MQAAPAADEPPLVVDPFAGGGSIPLEALRLGCEAFASDLNPVACLILKVMLEDIPRYGPKLAEELRRVGAEIKQQAEKELADFYPTDPDGATPIAYLWARTVRCESPNCGAEIPLARSCGSARRRNAGVRSSTASCGPRPGRLTSSSRFSSRKPRGRARRQWRAQGQHVSAAAGLPTGRVRAQLAAQRGGANVVLNRVGRRVAGARLLAVVTSTSRRNRMQL